MSPEDAIDRALDALGIVRECIRTLSPDWTTRAISDVGHLEVLFEDLVLGESEDEEWREDDNRQRQADLMAEAAADRRHDDE